MYDSIDSQFRNTADSLWVCPKTAEPSGQVSHVFVPLAVGLKPISDNVVQH